jgi:hypothetical protein
MNNLLSPTRYLRSCAVAVAVFLGLFAILPADAAPFAFSKTGSMGTAHVFHTATLLRNGKVLVAAGGGAGEIGAADIYDPATGSWTATGSLVRPRTFHTATLLPNGKVLIAGGLANSGGTQSSAELYDPATGTWSLTASMSIRREAHTATLLGNGKVLVTGGTGLGSAELYDPATETWAPTGSLSSLRARHSATLLQDGRVLVSAGGGPNSATTAELYDPATGQWSPTGGLRAAREENTATLLASGKVLMTGGRDSAGRKIASAELYDPATGNWTTTGSLPVARSTHPATLLPDGRVLVAGGINDMGNAIATAVLYNPATGTWSNTGSLTAVRCVHSATLLPNGNVLIAGGSGGSGNPLATAELYETNGPATALRNISTRLAVETGENVLIGGFIITGTAPKKVIIRAIGPSLGAKGVAGALADPMLELHKPDGSIVFNDNWRESEAAVQTSTIPPERDEESAIVETLPPGAYTAIVKGKGGTTGVGLVEVYDLDAAVPSRLENISTRGRVQTGENVMIGGFILGGSPNVTLVAARALGPSLGEAGVTDALVDPTLDLRDANGERIIFNDNWQDDPQSAVELSATGLAPQRAAEAAIYTILPAGNFTAIVADKASGGIGLLELYNIR